MLREENERPMKMQKLNIEEELRAIKEISHQTKELEARKKLQN